MTPTETVRLATVVRPRVGARGAVQLAVVVAGAAIALRTPELVALAAPLLLGLVVDLVAQRPGVVTLALEVPDGRALEGDVVELGIRVDVDRQPPPRSLRIRVETTEGLDGEGIGRVHHVMPGETLRLPTVATRWGVAGITRVEVSWASPLGLLGTQAAHHPSSRPVRVHPPVQRVRQLVLSRDTGAWAGARTATDAGQGIEFAELRPFASGDRPRDVVWRVSARRGEPWVATRHPEHSTDVVLVLDAFDTSAVDDVVRVAASLVDAHLRLRDRVGVLGLSGVLRWVVPGSGDRHRYRVLDLLLRTQVVQSWATRNLGTVPSRALPPGALVIVVTRLGSRMAAAVADLRARGRDVLVLDLTPAPAPAPRPDRERDLAARIVALQQADARDRLRRLGATVVRTEADGGLAAALAVAGRARQARAVAS